MGTGDLYEGEFKNGTRHGTGVYTWADGTRIQSVWEHGGTKRTYNCNNLIYK